MLKKLGLVAIVAGTLTACDGERELPLKDAPSPATPTLTTKTADPSGVTRTASEALEEKIELELVREREGSFVGSFNETYVLNNGKGLEFCDSSLRIQREISLQGQSSPVLSPDGILIVLPTYDADENGKFVVYQIEGTRLTEVVVKNAPYLGGVAFSPDGKMLAYTTHQMKEGKVSSNTLVLTETRFWQDCQRFDFEPIYSLGGTHIAFSRDNKTIAIRGPSTAVIDTTAKMAPRIINSNKAFNYRSNSDNILFDAQGRHLIGSNYKTTPDGEQIAEVQVYNIKTGEIEKQLLQQGNNVSVGITQQGLLIVGSRTKKRAYGDQQEKTEESIVRVYSKNFDLIGMTTIKSEGGLEHVKVSHDDRYIFAELGTTSRAFRIKKTP